MSEDDDLVLFQRAVRPQSRITRKAVDATIKAARESGKLPAGDCAQVALLRLIADELDQLRADTSTKAVWAKAQAWRELRDTMADFGLTSGASGAEQWFQRLQEDLEGDGSTGLDQ
jgi:hypothetical protein